MSDSIIPEKNQRHPWLAVVLSLLAVGLGQVYCGRLTRGLLFACLGTLSIAVTAALLANELAVGGFTLVLVGLAGLGGVVIVAAVDAYRLARRTRRDYAMKEYNQLLVYLLLFLMIKGGMLGALLYTRDQLLEAFIVPTQSMYPSIETGDRVLGNKRAYDRADPRRGDIVIFRDPANWRICLVKRIVAVAGDTVELKEGRLILNGQELVQEAVQRSTSESLAHGQMFREMNGDAPYVVLQSASAESQPTHFAAVTVPPHHCFVLGDHRSKSRDSRQFGPIPFTSIVARADYLYWPARSWTRFGRIGR